MMRLFFFLMSFSLCSFVAVADEIQLYVEIQGVDDPLLNNIRALLTIEKQKQNPRLTESSIQRMHQAAAQEIAQALQPFGYYRPTIDAQLQPPSSDQNTWQARYHITAGEVMPIAAVELTLLGEGEQDAFLQNSLKQFPIKINDPLAHLAYEQAKKNMLNAAQDRGYLEANYSLSKILVDMQAYAATIQLTLDTGKRFRFGQVTFEQESFEFESDFLNHFLTFNPGDYYSAQQFIAFRNALSSSGYFDQVNLEQENIITDADGHPIVPLRVKLKPLKKNKYRVRLGYGTDTQLRGKLDWERRYINDDGHRMQAGLIAVQEKRRLVSSLDYLIPVKNLNKDYWNFGVRYEGFDYGFKDFGLKEGGDTRLQSIALSTGRHYPRRLLNRWGVQESLTLEYLIEDYDLVEVIFEKPLEQEIFIRTRPELAQALNPQLKTLVPGIQWRYMKTDEKPFSQRGQQFSFSLKGALNGFLSTSSFVQTRAQGKYIHGLFSPSNRVIFRADIAYTHAETSPIFSQVTHDIPQSLQFRTGGDRSVRGYGFESLKSPNNLLYAKHLLVGSVEFEQMVIDKWSAALFYDTGNAFNSFSEMYLKESIGLGIRWYSPVGPVRLDVAHPLNDENADGFRIHINIGPDFSW
jgi:translocation and assembly module TamA